MGYNTEQTVWPTFSISNQTKALIDKFFRLMDDGSTGVGDKLADEVFTFDGSLSGATGTATGTSEIRRCRKNAWKVVQQRCHHVKKVYTHNADGSDLMLIGDAEMILLNGSSIVTEFTARMVIDYKSPSGPKLQSYHVWADTAPLSKALSNA